jgi:hypothetical protein
MRTLESESFMTAGLADAFLSVFRPVLQGKSGQEEIALVERSQGRSCGSMRLPG